MKSPHHSFQDHLFLWPLLLKLTHQLLHVLLLTHLPSLDPHHSASPCPPNDILTVDAYCRFNSLCRLALQKGFSNHPYHLNCHSVLVFAVLMLFQACLFSCYSFQVFQVGVLFLQVSSYTVATSFCAVFLFFLCHFLIELHILDYPGTSSEWRGKLALNRMGWAFQVCLFP